MTALAGFAVGVPAANLATGGAPDHLMPHSTPDLSAPNAAEQMWQAVRWSYLDGSLIPWLAHVLVWCGWALGIVLILLDAARLVRAGGAALHRHLAARTPRAWITSAVASALLLLSTTTANAQPAGPAVIATADQHPEPATPRPDPYHVPDDVRPDCLRHQVVHGDTYWSLAEHHLGDGRRFREIDALNHDRIPTPDLLLPGMTVLLPPGATGLPRPIPDGVPQVVVEPGETASSIAERVYGDPNAWHRLWDVDRNRPQPDGRAWRNPDLLLPGWRLQLAEPEPASTPSQPPHTPSSPAVAPPPATPPQIPPPPSPATTATSSPATAATTPRPDATVRLPTGAFVGIGLAALVTAAVFALRLRGRRHRPTNRHDPDPTLAPVVRALRVEYDRATMPKAFDGGLVYPEPTDVPYEVTGHQQAVATADTLMPATDTPLGLRDGHRVALDLAVSGGLGLDGPGGAAAARALLVTLYAQRHAHIVIPAAAVPLLFDTAEPERPALRIVADAPAALAAAAEMASMDTPIVLVLIAPGADIRARLETLINDHGVLAIVLGPWPAGTTITVTADGTATGPQWTDTRLFHLPATDATDLLSLFHRTHAAEHTAHDEPEAGLDLSPAPTVAGAIDQAPPLRLQVLGRLHLRWASTDQDLIDGLAPRQREILTYLALHPSGCRREMLTATLWPEAPTDRPHNAFHATLSQLRGALRKATGGTIDEITINIDGHFGLDPAMVSVDLWQLQDALRRITITLTPEDRVDALQRATDLYTGRLADGFAAGWIEAHRESIHRDALAAFSGLIRHVGQRDPAQMIHLLDRARELDPYNEAIYRDLMRVHARLGQFDSIRRTLTLLATSLAEIEERPTGDTIRLAHALAAHRGA